jgi:hypothetical protein
MEKFLHTPLDGRTLKEVLEIHGVEWIAAPAVTPAQSRTNAHIHGDFGDDALTMGSVAMRMLDRIAVVAYEADLALVGLQGHPAETPAAAEPSLPVAADTHAPGSVPVAEMAPEASHLPWIPVSSRGRETEVGIPIDPGNQRRSARQQSDAPNSTVQGLKRTGWIPVSQRS